MSVSVDLSVVDLLNSCRKEAISRAQRQQTICNNISKQIAVAMREDKSNVARDLVM